MLSPKLVDHKILSHLEKQIELGKWATTYLFTGKELARKKELAVAFAKALNCERSGSSLRGGRRDPSAVIANPAERGEAISGLGTGSAISEIASLTSFARNDVLGCGCTPCKKIEAGIHPDVKWYGTDEDVNSIKISDVRDFKNWLSLKSFEGKVKVFIFNQAERLTAEAQNALLKSIEEPPPGNVILFLVPTTKSLFDTIASRSVEIKVPAFTSKTIREILIEEGAPEVEAEFLARMSQGELTRAKEAFEAKWFRQKNQWIEALVKNPVSFLDQFYGASRDEISRAFQFLVEWTRDLLVFHASRDPDQIIHFDQHPLIESIVSKRDFESILELFESLGQIGKSIDDYANQKLVLTQAEILLEHFLK